jgi:hypothetical protein
MKDSRPLIGTDGDRLRLIRGGECVAAPTAERQHEREVGDDVASDVRYEVTHEVSFARGQEFGEDPGPRRPFWPKAGRPEPVISGARAVSLVVWV